MSTGHPERTATSLLARLLSSQSHRWIALGLSLLLVLAPAVFAYLDGLRSHSWLQGYWRLPLFLSVLVPGGAALAGFVGDVLFR